MDINAVLQHSALRLPEKTSLAADKAFKQISYVSSCGQRNSTKFQHSNCFSGYKLLDSTVSDLI